MFCGGILDPQNRVRGGHKHTCWHILEGLCTFHSRPSPLVLADILVNTTQMYCDKKISYLSFNYPIYNGLQGFQLTALHNTFKILRAVLEGLCHCDV